MSDVELYEFTRGSRKWCYTNGLSSYYFGGETYNPEIISYNRVMITNSVFKSGITIDISHDSAIAVELMTGLYGETCTLRIWRDELAFWSGRVSMCTVKNDRASISCESIYSTIKRLGVKNTFERLCRFNVYDPDCGVAIADYRDSNCEIVSYTGRVVTIRTPGGGVVPGGDEYYKTGVLLHAGNYYMILSRDTDLFTLIRPLHGASAGQAVALHPGCDRMRGTCNTRFSNILYNGGFPHMPTVDVYETGIV